MKKKTGDGGGGGLDETPSRWLNAYLNPAFHCNYWCNHSTPVFRYDDHVVPHNAHGVGFVGS